jgi:branched-chain amino acid transport system substrate-binding protein
MLCGENEASTTDPAPEVGGCRMGMTGRRLLVLAAAAAVIASASACSSSGKTSAGAAAGGGGGGGQTYTIGLLTDLSGVAASAESTTPVGVKAGVGLANSEGYHIKYVVADAASSPAGALAAAQKLVAQDHVFAVIAVSGLTFAAAPYLTSHGIPVLGAATDGPEWIASRNMFSVFGTEDYHKVATTYGQFFRTVGVTNLASLGYSIVPSSNLSAKGAAVSAEEAGLKVGYLNANFPLGGTNVAPAALAMKSAGVDGYTGAVEENTSFALVGALRQEGVDLKAALFAVGYGADLEQGGPGAQQAAQGSYFTLSYEPVEMNTPATQRLQNALKTYAGVTGDPSLNEYLGYASVDAFVTGLKSGGSKPSQAAFINTMLGIRSYNAAGLFGSHSIGFAMDQRGQAAGADNCVWVTKYSGSSFQLVQGAIPICGTTIPGKTVSASS